MAVATPNIPKRTPLPSARPNNNQGPDVPAVPKNPRELCECARCVKPYRPEGRRVSPKTKAEHVLASYIVERGSSWETLGCWRCHAAEKHCVVLPLSDPKHTFCCSECKANKEACGLVPKSKSSRLVGAAKTTSLAKQAKFESRPPADIIAERRAWGAVPEAPRRTRQNRARRHRGAEPRPAQAEAHLPTPPATGGSDKQPVV